MYIQKSKIEITKNQTYGRWRLVDTCKAVSENQPMYPSGR